jgi:hypothetical protein
LGAVYRRELGAYLPRLWQKIGEELTGRQMAAWEFQTLQNIADRNGWHKFISMQNYYNLIYREEEREMVRLPLPVAKHI